MRRHVFQAHDIAHAVLTGYFYPTMLHLQYGLGNALASAYNDYCAEQWLARDDRLIHEIEREYAGSSR